MYVPGGVEPMAYHFAHITRGAGIFASKSCHNEPVQAGDIFILFPTSLAPLSSSPKTGWSEYWIDFDGDYIRRLMAHKEFSKDEPVFLRHRRAGEYPGFIS